MKRSFYFILGAVIILVGLYPAKRLQADSTVPSGLIDSSFHNQLHLFQGDPSINRHAAQMGYDYTTYPDAHTYGLKLLKSYNTAVTWLNYRDGQYHPENGMTAPTRAEYDVNVCMHDAGNNDPIFRYYIEWVSYGAPCFSEAECKTGPSALSFYMNFRSQTAISNAINYLETHTDWANIDAAFLDHVFGYAYKYLGPSYAWGTSYNVGEMTDCANPNPDYSFDEGFLRYRRTLRDLFRSHGLPVSGNPFDMSLAGTQELHANTPMDHYYSESGEHQNVSQWGIVPANMVSLEVPYPAVASGSGKDFNLNFAVSGQAAVQGSWFGSYGEDHEWIFTIGPGGNSITPGMNAIQLLRAMPNWDNLMGAANRSWNGLVYSSTNSYASSDVVYSRHPKTGKLFVVFRSGTAVLPLRASETVASVYCVDGLFIERGDCAGHFAVNDSEVRLAGSGQLNQGYIVELR